MKEEYIIEFANCGQNDWEEHFSYDRSDFLVRAATWPLGKVVVTKGISDAGPFDFCRVPTDPLLKAIVIAREKGK